MKLSNDTAKAVPTKQFFVSMLTRDISLDDAILDLIDNCLDGAMRLANGGDVDYGKHHVKIKLSKDLFSIEDNCGGIPREVAINYAFKMGRDADDKRDADTETIGMYGVGMKRALFKMGTDALVKTRHGEDTFEVHIDSNWLSDKEWRELPIKVPSKAAEMLDYPGTSIVVKDLYPGVAKHFANAAFINDVETAISHHFTMFLQRGLRIELNGRSVKPVRVEVLVSRRKDGPAPYVYQKTIDGVLVSITVGLNTSRQYEGDSDHDEVGDFAGQRNSATAGWTVLCNDRAVIVGDKSRLTGWGDGIPLYHDQFIVITGIIEFRAKDAKKLPVTTTKRALDTSSDVWLESLVKMKEGMRVWISYTNQWKNHPREDQSVYWSDAKPMSLSQAIEAVSPRATKRRGSVALEFDPRKMKGVLPEPKESAPSGRRIVFSRPAEEVRLVSKMLFDDANEKPGIVGDKCFEIQLVKASRVER
ncbi:ATP-binding protein [Arenimonas caeni]|uniref:ATP-binding protein n=1 Tax=Arenimonas caeni TaxID=2058085 RepID=A0A2P6M8D6_9GAMM|nr:ATP-binding protein [Arenimonas caeni]PRH82257.1 ATP-binding protein [Arenimonas caeni]